MTINYNPRIVTDGLVLALDAGNLKSYPGTGTTWTNLSRRGNNGTLTNGPTYSSSNGGSIVFDGVDDYANCGTVSDYTFGTGQFSIDIWFKRNGTQGSFASVISSSGGTDWQLEPDPLKFKGNSTTYDFNNATIPNLTWANVVIVREGTGTNQTKFYYNSLLDSTHTISDNFAQGQLKIGVNRGTISYFNGNISISRLYVGKALTAAEVQQNFNALRGRYGI